MTAPLSYSVGHSEQPLMNMTLGDAFDQTVLRYPDNEALIVKHQGIRYSYLEFKQEVDRIARAFLSLGVEVGERVGIWAPNCVEWVITQLATAKIGAVLVNVNPAYQSAELDYALQQSGTRYLVMADQFKHSNYTQMLHQLVPELASCEPGQLHCARFPQLQWIINLNLQVPQEQGMLSWQSFYQKYPDISLDTLKERQHELHCDDPINIQYTSGTTGFPKGATLSHKNILNNGYFVTQSMNFTDRDRLIIPIPLYHCFGMVMGNLGCITQGATMIYPSTAFDPLTVLQTVAEEKATALYSVPTMFISILEHPEFDHFDLSSLRTGIMAGSICPAEIMKAVNQKMHMSELQIAYGMTETSPVSTQTGTTDSFDKRVSTVGRTQPHLAQKIIDNQGAIVPRGETGELCTKGYSVMLGYWNNAQATKEAIDKDQWMHTGDLATMDEQGYIRIVGRIKDMVIRGGENIYPKEIEDFLYTHPQISDVQVTGVPDEKFGEELVAWIKLTPDEINITDQNELTEESVREYCKGQISHFKIPRYIKFVDAFPLTVTGKVQKFKIREAAIKELNLNLN